ncbi:MAG: alpha/beta hydrolase [Mycobacterium sp.]|jgi:fermentation-respiration switch protein FrsA (DUF1100 family)|nr:alpha/beta hydrolase [Mycobacterium sp.]
MNKIDVPTLILHGDDDQIAPVGNATLAAALVPDAILKIYPGAPHAMTTTHKDQVIAVRRRINLGQAENRRKGESLMSNRGDVLAGVPELPRCVHGQR